MKRVFVGLAAAALLAATASAQQATPRMAITIYNNDIALVEDVRNVEVAAGRSRIDFPGVSAEIQPETASLVADGVSIVEQNFDFDLLTPFTMMGLHSMVLPTSPVRHVQATLSWRTLARLIWSSSE